MKVHVEICLASKLSRLGKSARLVSSCPDDTPSASVKGLSQCAHIVHCS